MYEHSASCVFV